LYASSGKQYRLAQTASIKIDQFEYILFQAPENREGNDIAGYGEKHINAHKAALEPRKLCVTHDYHCDCDGT
jgi:hypothetical protein